MHCFEILWRSPRRRERVQADRVDPRYGFYDFYRDGQVVKSVRRASVDGITQLG
ncbi:hypothetical protein [Nonomuraea sediminis]|uniref:hypothetical protein n=1 Tax=Nonomuraea sediminis TaxID=2835864 RepID=UPI001BDD9E4E|nr:hypothetical protein [Nonomuraea sediminis]